MLEIARPNAAAAPAKSRSLPAFDVAIRTVGMRRGPWGRHDPLCAAYQSGSVSLGSAATTQPRTVNTGHGAVATTSVAVAHGRCETARAWPLCSTPITITSEL